MLYFLNIYTLDSWETRGHTSKTWQILTGCFVFFLLNQLVVYLIQSFPLICSVLDKKWQECCGRPISQHKPTSFRTLWSCRDISRHVISRVNAKPKLFSPPPHGDGIFRVLFERAPFSFRRLLSELKFPPKQADVGNTYCVAAAASQIQYRHWEQESLERFLTRMLPWKPPIKSEMTPVCRFDAVTTACVAAF